MRFTLRQRHEAMVDKSGGPDACWPWTGSQVGKDKHGVGYGQLMGPDHKPLAAHRLAYQFEHGRIPKGAMVLHRCGNRACCNPAHLYTGDNAQNMRDKSRHGRAAKRLTPQAVALIRAEWQVAVEQGRKHGTVARLVRQYGVNRKTVQDIIDGLSWRHLEPVDNPPQLNVDAVRAIREQYAAGATAKTLAAAYGVTPQCIYDITARRTWTRVR